MAQEAHLFAQRGLLVRCGGSSASHQTEMHVGTEITVPRRHSPHRGCLRGWEINIYIALSLGAVTLFPKLSALGPRVRRRGREAQEREQQVTMCLRMCAYAVASAAAAPLQESLGLLASLSLSLMMMLAKCAYKQQE